MCLNWEIKSMHHIVFTQPNHLMAVSQNSQTDEKSVKPTKTWIQGSQNKVDLASLVYNSLDLSLCLHEDKFPLSGKSPL